MTRDVFWHAFLLLSDVSDEVFRVVVLAEGFVEETLFVLFGFLGVTMCFNSIVQGLDAPDLVLGEVDAVVVQNLICASVYPVYLYMEGAVVSSS